MRNYYSNFIQQITGQDENLSLSKISNVDYISLAFAKSEAECGNSKLYKANTSTPFYYRAFFVRSLRVSKECYNLARSSMMAYSGQGIALDCLPCIAVFPPRYTLSPYTVESVADSSSKFIQGLSAMIYKFLTLNTGSKRLRISIFANSLEEALSKCQFTQRPLLIARLNPNFAKNRPNLTACNAKGGVYA